MNRATRALGALGLGAGAAALLATPAGAHISPDKDEVAADSFASVTLTVPHGCDESPTKALSIEIPEGIISASPQVHPGWTIAVQEEELAEPVEDEGEQITGRTASITFTAEAGNELPVHYRDTFTIGFRAPDTPGEYLYVKTIQTCVAGETAWIEEWDGEGDEPEHPAPAMLVTESTGDEHGGDEATEEGEPETDSAASDEASSASDSEDDDGGSDGLAAGALVVAVLALAGSGFAVYRTRKPTAD